MATPAESHGKDDEEQQCRDRGGPNGLQLHLEEAPDLLHIKSTHPRPVHIADQRNARFGAHCRYGAVNFMLFVHDEIAYRVAAEPASTFFRRQHSMGRSEEHTSELQSLMRISYAVFCLKNKKQT